MINTPYETHRFFRNRQKQLTVYSLKMQEILEPSC